MASRGINKVLQGWVVKARKQGKVSFLQLSDGLSPNKTQVVISRDVISSVPVGSALRVEGHFVPSIGSQQDYEFVAENCTVLATDIDPRYDDLSPDVLRKNTHLRTKNQSFAAIMRIRSRLLFETHKFYQERQFVHIDAPMLTSNDCEGAGETFTIQDGIKIANSDPDRNANFFGSTDPVLTVSSQLHLEAMTSGISKVYTVNGAFRADKQQSSTHVAEFRMVEAEVAFCNTVEQICQLAEDYVRHSARAVVEHMEEDIAQLGKYSSFDSSHSRNPLFEMLDRSDRLPQIKFSEALDVLQGHKQKTSSNGLSRQNELFLVQHFNSPLFVTHFPSSQKPFYMKRTANEEETLSFDLLFPGIGELAGGSVREDDCEKLVERRESVLDGLGWYVDCRKRGKPVSAGFGVGFERLLQTLLGVKNIKDTIPFPRWYKHCQC